ncbi:MAG: HlyD family efflux transporter periplasmic adaptor subunit [Betaproteobacteria bacterium]|nr:MAG: HlyD family efflux transporter periplasmic adaptor subunit [Betaproteobacteria bacterium]
MIVRRLPRFAPARRACAHRLIYDAAVPRVTTDSPAMKIGWTRLGVVIVVLAVGAAGWYWYGQRNGSGEVKYRLGKVERGPIQAVVVASGTLNAVTTVQVGSQISGQVKEIFADFNTPVKQDQIIARIDPATFELSVSRARADLDAANSAVAVARSALAAQQAELGRVRVQLADALRDLERKQSLVAKNYLSPAELDRARTLYDATREQQKAVEAQIRVNLAQVESAQAAVKQRQALLQQAQVDLGRTVIRAPVDGTVILRNIDAGQTVAASLQAPVLFTIAKDLRDMQVEAAIDEADVGRLRVGQAASFTVDAFPRRNFSGEIRQVRKSPQTVQNVVSYVVVISAANPDLSLLPGMTANVRVVVDSRDSVLKVANAALRFRPAGAAETRPAAQAAPVQQAGGAAAQQFRQRLLEDLKPDASQKAKLESILDDVRQKMAQVRDLAKEADRRKQLERIRAESRARIADILNPEQKAVYERLLGELGGRASAAATGRLWVPGDTGQPKAVEVRTGLSDGSSTELMSGPLQEGDSVILGVLDRTGEKKAGGPPGPRLF